MSCEHFWLPHHGTLFRYVFCGHCHERRRVRFAPMADDESIADALGDAIDRGVIPNHEVTWKGQRLR